jgi:DNA polymerase III delta prime subunit
MDSVLGQDNVVSFLRSRITNPPHFILAGPTGSGKTMLAHAFVTEQLQSQGVVSKKHQNEMTLRLTSSDDRGITAIRQRLTEFVRRVRPVPGTFAWVIVDDADNLPTVTQQALRRILELHAHQAHFCFISQNTDNFIEPIQSRCVVLHTKPVDLDIYGSAIAKREGANLSDDAVHLVGSLCMGNARQCTLICQAVAIAFEPSHLVTPTDIQLLVNAPPVKTLLALQNAVVARDLSAVTENALALWSRGYNFEECISMLEMVVRIYNEEITRDLQYVLQCCAEGHIFQIMNKTTTLDLIAVLAGCASSEALA